MEQLSPDLQHMFSTYVIPALSWIYTLKTKQVAVFHFGGGGREVKLVICTAKS